MTGNQKGKKNKDRQAMTADDLTSKLGKLLAMMLITCLTYLIGYVS